MASFFASSKIIVFVTFSVYVLTGNSITASTVFVTVSLYGTIKLTVTLFFPLAVERLSETRVSVHRIKVEPDLTQGLWLVPHLLILPLWQNFLLLGEVKSGNIWLPLEEKKAGEDLLKIERITCFWDKVSRSRPAAAPAADWVVSSFGSSVWTLRL